MTNVEIYDSSNSQLSSDEYSHEEEDYDALMDAAVSKQRPQKTKSMGSETEKPGNGAPESAVATEKDAKPVDAAVPPSTRSETLRRIRQLQLQRGRLPNLYFKRRSIRWLRPNKMEYSSYFDGLKDLVAKRKLKHLVRVNARRRRTYDSRSPSRSRSHSRSFSRSRSRSRSRSYSRSRSGSGSPELICLDDTENEESPEKPEPQARVTPIKENMSRVPAPPQLNYEMPERKRANTLGSNENGASILDEFLVKKDPHPPVFDYGKLSACLELEQALKDQSQGDPDVAESLVLDATLKRRRSVTPPAIDERRNNVEVEDDEIIEFLPVQQRKPIEAAPPLNLQMPSTPTANPLQCQPAFKLSTPYSLASPSAAKQSENSTPESYSLNTPTPTATPMEISYPNEKLSNNMRGDAQTFSIQQALPQVAASYAAAPQVAALAQRVPAQAAPLLQASVQQMHFPRSAPPQQLPAAKPPQQQLPSASSSPPQHLARPRLASPHQLVPPKAVPSQHLAPPQQLGTPRSIPPQQLSTARSAPPQQVAPPQQPDLSRLASVQPLTPQREAAPHQIAPPQQVHQTPSQPYLAPIVAPNFAVPQQPQPRRSDTVSTQTQGLQSPTSSSTTRQKSSIDLNNSDANFHYRIKELFEEFNTIMIDKIDSVRPENDSLRKERERIDADLATLDKLIAQKEEEYNRLLHLRCVKKELHDRLQRKERMTLIRDLLPVLLNKSCSADELREMQAMLEEEQDAPMASKQGLSAVEKCLNFAEYNQNNIRLLRGIMGLKERAPPANPRYFEEDQMLFRRDSMPASHQSMRDQRYDSRDVVNDHQPERSPDRAPLAKRPKLMHPQDRNQEMSSSSANLSATLSESLNKIKALKKRSRFSNIPLDNNLDNESLIEPLFNSSPMVSHRQLANRQHYQELHSANSNDQEKAEKKHRSHKNKPHKSTHKSHRESSNSATTNGKTGRHCHECKLYEATYMCSNCQNQWYCSRECQLRGWDSHYRTCGI
ncbi:titin [Drosophila teissieri]|uniref:titin n=1 Tax=Drosophila teissieri TaxID=7243 RepID=UPI001CB9E17A|nr:titin [Drosophila teissieri]XP_043647243.1 titin [Drosophila teissieri]